MPKSDVWAEVADWRALAFRALRRMYLPDQHLFIHCMRRSATGEIRPEGISLRYTAITLMALATESPAVVSEILHGQSIDDVCRALADRTGSTEEIGAVALTLWALRLHLHPRADEVLKQLQAMKPAQAVCPTVELAWCLSALSVPNKPIPDTSLARAVADRLLASFRYESGLFAHYPAGVKPPRLRGHVACFADLVYPTQALSYYHMAAGERRALDAARRCGERMCELQGPQGQWWWHYDIRSGQVVEGFPVYAVHQDGMGPMALFALEDASGIKHWDAVQRSADWLIRSPELSGGSLVDKQADLIWRKVARREPNKLVRMLQATASCLHPKFRVPGIDAIFPPGQIDYESRPYHMGWLLFAFSAERLQKLSAL